MMKAINFSLFLAYLLILGGCSPLKSSPEDEKHKLELTLHEVQANLDDVKHDINCFQTDLHIMDDRIKHQEESFDKLKSESSSQIRSKIDFIEKRCALIEEKLQQFEKEQTLLQEKWENLASHANTTTTALTQHQQKILELQKETNAQSVTLKQLSHLKSTLEWIVNKMKTDESTHVVKSGETLEKIAKKYNITVDKLKKINNLKKDLIFSGQQLQIPNS